MKCRFEINVFVNYTVYDLLGGYLSPCRKAAALLRYERHDVTLFKSSPRRLINLLTSLSTLRAECCVIYHNTPRVFWPEYKLFGHTSLPVINVSRCKRRCGARYLFPLTGSTSCSVATVHLIGKDRAGGIIARNLSGNQNNKLLFKLYTSLKFN